MALYRWPTDPPGKAPAHTITYEQHKRNSGLGGAGSVPGAAGGAINALVSKQVAPAGYTPEQIQTITNITKGGTVFPTVPIPGPAATQPAQPPVNPALDGLIAGIDKDRDTTVGQLEARRPQVLADYGYKATGYGSDGAALGLTFDASNPFSKAALLLRNYNQQQAGTKNSMAARGQLFSGAFLRGKRENEFGYQRGDDAIKKALTGALVGIGSGIASAKSGAETRKSQALLDYAPKT